MKKIQLTHYRCDDGAIIRDKKTALVYNKQLNEKRAIKRNEINSIIETHLLGTARHLANCRAVYNSVTTELIAICGFNAELNQTTETTTLEFKEFVKNFLTPKHLATFKTNPFY